MSDWSAPPTADDMRADFKAGIELLKKATRDFTKPQRYRPHAVKMDDGTTLFGTLDTKTMVLHPPFARVKL